MSPGTDSDAHNADHISGHKDADDADGTDEDHITESGGGSGNDIQFKYCSSVLKVKAAVYLPARHSPWQPAFLAATVQSAAWLSFAASKLEASCLSWKVKASNIPPSRTGFWQPAFPAALEGLYPHRLDCIVGAACR